MGTANTSNVYTCLVTCIQTLMSICFALLKRERTFVFFVLFSMILMLSIINQDILFGSKLFNIKIEKLAHKAMPAKSVKQVKETTSGSYCNFLTFIFDGRLGNNMFQYASAYGLSKINKKKLFIKYPDFELRKIFKLTAGYANYTLDNFTDAHEEKCCEFDKNITQISCDKNVTITGYRSSYKYFDIYRKLIKKEFTFQDKISRQCDKIKSIILQRSNPNINRSRNCFLIGAHMRRGDFTLDSAQTGGYVPADSGYLQRAVDYFENRFKSQYECIQFLIIGDDRIWNMQNSPKQPNVIVLNNGTPEIHLCVLSRCNGNIMSTGSFSWWGAYLSGGPTTYMKNQCRPGSKLCEQFKMQDYINSDWDWTPL